jgi:hypothetical protein
MAHTRCKTRYPRECGCRSQTRQPGVPDEWGNISLLSLLTTSRRMCVPLPLPPFFNLQFLLSITPIRINKRHLDIRKQ